MKIKIIKYCHEKIDGVLCALDVNKILEVSDDDAINLVLKNLAEEIPCPDFGKEETAEIKPQKKSGQEVLCNNKMINLIYRGFQK